MKVRDIMSQPVVSCGPETSLAQAAKRMREADCGVLPVVRGDLTVAGVITDRDICLELARSHRSAPNIYVREVMTGNVVTIGENEPLGSALLSMKEARVRRLPVVDDRGRAVGLLSIEDLIVRGLEAGAVDVDSVMFTLRSICERRLVEANVEADCAVP